MSTPDPIRLLRDTALHKAARGRNTATPCGHRSKAEIAAAETRRLLPLDDAAFCDLVDSGQLHCRAMARLLGRTRTFGSYRAAHETLTAKLNNKGPGAASEIVGEVLLQRLDLPVSCSPSPSDLQVKDLLVEVKSSYKDAFRNAKKGHQVAINRRQLECANYLLAVLVSTDNEGAKTEISWVFAPMELVREHVETRLAGQAGNEEVTMHFQPAPARATFASHTYTRCADLLDAMRDRLA